MDNPEDNKPESGAKREVTAKDITDAYSVRKMLSGVYKTYTPDSTDEEQARRLARLLVQEIQMYNEKKIAEGRRDSNIYDLVQDAIEQSRTYFRERLGELAEEFSPIFEDELIAILCEGDATKLGPSYHP